MIITFRNIKKKKTQAFKNQKVGQITYLKVRFWKLCWPIGTSYLKKKKVISFQKHALKNDVSVMIIYNIISSFIMESII